MSEFGLDDLLDDEEESGSSETRRRRFRWLRYLLAAGAATAVTIVGMRMFGVELSTLAIFGGFLALLAVRWVTRQAAAPPPSRRHAYRGLDPHQDAYQAGERDALRSAVKRWEKAFGRAGGDRKWFHQELLPMLGELVDERLRQRHGLTRESDPQRARALLGEPLWKVLTGKPRRSPSPRDYAAILAELEKT